MPLRLFSALLGLRAVRIPAPNKRVTGWLDDRGIRFGARSHCSCLADISQFGEQFFVPFQPGLRRRCGFRLFVFIGVVCCHAFVMGRHCLTAELCRRRRCQPIASHKAACITNRFEVAAAASKHAGAHTFVTLYPRALPHSRTHTRRHSIRYD